MIDKEEVIKLAQLARIKISKDEAEVFRGEIESILDFISEIQDATVKERKLEVGNLRNVMRDDGEPHKSGEFTEDLLAAVPSREKDYVKVKKIISQD